MIRFENVTKVYARGARPALDRVSLDVERGEFVFLVGASGSGKSTFLRLVLREERASAGRVFVAGKELGTLSSWKVPQLRRQIGAVFQDFRLLPNKTVFENVAFALQVIGKPRHHILTTVPDTLEMVGLAGKEKRRPHELSGGEQQRVAIARAFVNRPEHPAVRRADGKPRPDDVPGDHAPARPDQPHRHHRRHGDARRRDRRPDAQARHRAVHR